MTEKMKTSNEERREVAARLRKLAPGSDWPDMTAEACGLNPREMSNCFHEFTGELCDRLADLIEPEPEETCLVEQSVHDFDGSWHYLSCGHRADTWLKAPPNYCPDCGCRVRSDDE